MADPDLRRETDDEDPEDSPMNDVDEDPEPAEVPAAPAPPAPPITPKTPMEEEPSLEETLFTCETLDRSSPDLWPRQTIFMMEDTDSSDKSPIHENNVDSKSPVPGLSEYVTLRSENSRDSWASASNSKSASAADIHLMQQLGTLSTSGLIIEVKKLHDLAYQLGIEEAKEMTRGKYLNIFKSRSQQ